MTTCKMGGVLVELQICGETQGRKWEQGQRFSKYNDIVISNKEEWGVKLLKYQGSMWQWLRFYISHVDV